MSPAFQSPSKAMENMSTTATTAEPRAGRGLTTEALEILTEERGLNEELLARLGVRSGRTGKDGSLFIEIPYLVLKPGKDGEAVEVEVNTKTRTITGEKEFYQQKGGEKVFYNADAINQWQRDPKSFLIITEGEFDAITAIQHGHYAVSVPDGAPAEKIGDSHSIKYGYMDDFPKTGNVILAVDGDEPGLNLLHDLADRIGRHRCQFITYPKGCKDLNEVQVRYGDKGITETLKRAKWMHVDGVYRMNELPPLPAHDEIPLCVVPITIRTSELVILTGIPGHGKTTLLNHALADIVEREQRVVAIASFEQSPTTEHRKSLRTLFLGYAPHLADAETIARADAWIDKHFVFIVPDDDSDEDVDLTWLLNKMATAVARYGASILVIDPWNEIDHMFDRLTMSQTDYTGFAVKQLKKFGRRYRVAVIVVAHPAKMKKERNGETPVPTMYDIADSAHWANKADVGIVVHQKQGKVLCRLQKARYRDAHGDPGDYWLSYDRDNRRFTEAEAPKPPAPKVKEPKPETPAKPATRKSTKKGSMKDMLPDPDEPVATEE